MQCKENIFTADDKHVSQARTTVREQHHRNNASTMGNIGKQVLGNPKHIPKHTIPCPFLRKRSWCLKNKCCFSPISTPNSVNCPRTENFGSTPLLEGKEVCKKGSACDFSHYFHQRRASHRHNPPQLFASLYQLIPSPFLRSGSRNPPDKRTQE